MLSEDLLPLPGIGTLVRIMIDFRLQPTESGTRLIQTFSKAKGPLHGRIISNLVLSKFGSRWQKFMDAFKESIETDLAKRGGLPREGGGLSAGAIEEAPAASLVER